VIEYLVQVKNSLYNTIKAQRLYVSENAPPLPKKRKLSEIHVFINTDPTDTTLYQIPRHFVK
jgi:hypothetical protein